MSTLIRNVATSLLQAIRFMLAVLRAIFGEIRWSPPSWIRRTWGAARVLAYRISGSLNAARRQNPTRFWISNATILLLIVGTIYGVRWYRHRPPPRYVQIIGILPHAPEFRASFVDAQFYENPTDPKDKRVVATIKFTHPVNKADFEKRIALRMRVKPVKSFESRDTCAFDFKVSYDRTGGIAYIHSDPFTIPERAAEMQIKIGADVHSSRGGPGTPDPLLQTVSIPGIATYFRILYVSAQPITNERGEMERVATLNSSVPLKQNDLANSISVVMLPKDRPAIGDQKIRKDYRWNDATEAVPDFLIADSG